MFAPLRLLFEHVVKTGDLTVVDAGGKRHRFGQGAAPQVEIALSSRATEWRIALDPELRLGEAYTTGNLTITAGDLYDLLEILTRDLGTQQLPRWANALGPLRRAVRHLAQYNPAGLARRRIQHHYDIEPAIYDLFLDRARQYSCAYFEPGQTDLEQAQHAKQRHIAAKLGLAPGQKVLEIGSGWGGLGLYLAGMRAVSLTGITLSQEQLTFSRDAARRQGLDRQVRFELADYRAIEGAFDRIVSVGMFEHVGAPHYGTYFKRIRELLAPGGVALIHAIARSDGPDSTNPFIAKYIFPGGYIPALSEVLPAVERTGLIVSDIEIWRLHYAETLKAWRQRFQARREDAAAIKGAEFVRMWEFYLAASECAFRYQGLVVFQLQLVNDIAAAPITRDYMARAEAALLLDEAGMVPGRQMAGE